MPTSTPQFQRQLANSKSVTRISTVTPDNRNAATDNANLNAPRNQTTKGSISAANAGTGAVAVQGRNNTVNITNSDGGALQAVSGLISRVLDSQANTSTGAISAVTGLAETRVTDGQNITQRTILYIVLAIAAFWALARLGKH